MVHEFNLNCQSFFHTSN